MRITAIFIFLIACCMSAIIGANITRPATTQNQPPGKRSYPHIMGDAYVIGIDKEGNTLYKEILAEPPARQLFPNWLAADSLHERGTPEWERTALHPAMKVDEWRLELQRLADEH